MQVPKGGCTDHFGMVCNMHNWSSIIKSDTKQAMQHRQSQPPHTDDVHLPNLLLHSVEKYVTVIGIIQSCKANWAHSHAALAKHER